jgi:DNA-directed RNA polymerases I, II, and III subunit RPABC2
VTTATGKPKNSRRLNLEPNADHDGASRSDDEPAYEDYDAEPEYLDQELEEDVGGGEDPDAKDADDRHIINSGDVAAASQQQQTKRKAAVEGRNTVEEVKARKIPNDKRSTTPYMTKYERARVLGTRALQIR